MGNEIGLPPSQLGITSLGVTTPNIELKEMEKLLQAMRKSEKDQVDKNDFQAALKQVDKFQPPDVELFNQLFILFDEQGHEVVDRATMRLASSIDPLLAHYHLRTSGMEVVYGVEEVSVSLFSPHGYDPVKEELMNRLSSTVARNERTVQEIRRWASTNHPVDVTKAAPERYIDNVLLDQLGEKKEKTIADTVDPSKTRQECRDVESKRVAQHSKRYGGHCFVLFGPRKYRDYWTDVTYCRECRSHNYNQAGELLNITDWISSGCFTKQVGRYKENVCP
eukprot:gene8818-9722_t